MNPQINVYCHDGQRTKYESYRLIDLEFGTNLSVPDEVPGQRLNIHYTTTFKCLKDFILGNKPHYDVHSPRPKFAQNQPGFYKKKS